MNDSIDKYDDICLDWFDAMLREELNSYYDEHDYGDDENEDYDLDDDLDDDDWSQDCDRDWCGKKSDNPLHGIRYKSKFDDNFKELYSDYDYYNNDFSEDYYYEEDEDEHSLYSLYSETLHDLEKIPTRTKKRYAPYFKNFF